MLEIRQAPKEHLPWLVERAGFVPSVDLCAVEAVGEHGIRGMVGFESWAPNSVTAHMAAEDPSVWRRLLGPAFWFAFVQNQRGVMLGVIPASNEKALGFVRRVGFREAHRVRDGFRPGVDLVVNEMRREECRWLPGQEVTRGRQG